MSLDDVYGQASETTDGAGGTVIPAAENLIKIIKRIGNEEEKPFVLAFNDQKCESLDPLVEKLNFSEEQFLEMAQNFAKKEIDSWVKEKL